MMKKVLATVLIVTVLIIGGIFIAGALENRNQDSTSEQNNTTSPTSQSTETDPSTINPNEERNSFTAAEVAQRSKSSDCWIIVDGNVYDVTKYLNSHPGGAQRIIPSCGKDATNAFKTQGGEGSHSSQASSILSSFMIGTLKD